eukprot:TRINITY_DN47083_c0_g1_i1.p2 TRINITY_DN47083_c0_g1~~TRINITY_DN47083_c0_g1_i1.p2  ORF type:complete len:185 (-),score=45.14 TRINITY_DN47083_c0_g1_i1:188-742(-)
MALSRSDLVGRYCWDENGMADSWSCYVELLEAPQRLADGDASSEFTAISRYSHFDLSGEMEACCCYGHWRLEAAEVSESAQSAGGGEGTTAGQLIRFDEWRVGPDRPPQEHEGEAFFPCDELEAPLAMRVCLGAADTDGEVQPPQLRPAEWDGKADHVMQVTKEAFRRGPASTQLLSVWSRSEC